MAKSSAEQSARIGDGVAATAALLVAFYLASRILGFVRQAVIASLFGVGPEADAWFAAFRIPDTLFTLFAGGALVSALIPVYTRYRDFRAREDLRRLATGLFNLVAVFMIVVGALGAVFAQPLTDLIVPGFDEPTKELTARATRWLMLSPLLLGLAAVAKGISQSERRFLIPAAGPVFYNIGTIIGGVLLAGQHGIMGLVWGTVAGALVHLAIQQVGLARIGITFPFSTVVAHPGVARVISLMIPRLLGFTVIQVSFFFVNFLASLIGPASVSALANAWLLLLFPVGVLAIPFAEAALPAFSSRWVRGDRDGLAREYHWAFRRVLFLVVPASVGLAVLAEPVLSVLFERDAFDAAATSLTAGALVFYSVGLAGHGSVEVLARAFYSMQDTKTPVIIGSVSVALHMLVSWLLSLSMGINGLALGVSVGVLVEAVLLYAFLRRRLAAAAYDRATSLSAARTLAASVLMGLAVFGAVWYTWEGGSTLPNLGLLAGYMALGAAVFSIVAGVLGSEELFALARRVRAKLASRKPYQTRNT